MKINELKPGGHIELIVEVKSIQKIRKLWKCFGCDQRGMWKEEEEFKDACPNCGTSISDAPGKGLWLQDIRSILIKDESGMTYLDLWKEDAHNENYITIGNKLHLINGYARQNSSGGVNVSKGKFGTLKRLE